MCLLIMCYIIALKILFFVGAAVKIIPYVGADVVRIAFIIRLRCFNVRGFHMAVFQLSRKNHAMHHSLVLQMIIQFLQNHLNIKFLCTKAFFLCGCINFAAF